MIGEAVPVEAVMSVETAMPVEASAANGPARVTSAEARTACAARVARQTDCQYDRQRGDRDKRQLSRTSKLFHVRAPLYLRRSGAAADSPSADGQCFSLKCRDSLRWRRLETTLGERRMF